METKKTKSEELSFLKDVISKLGAVVFIVNLESLEYILGNGKYYDMFGYQKGEIFMNIMELAENYFHPDDKPIVRERVKAFRGKQNKLLVRRLQDKAQRRGLGLGACPVCCM